MAKIENIRCLYGFVHGLGEFAIKQGRKMRYGIIAANGEIVLEPRWKKVYICDRNTIILCDSRKVLLSYPVRLDYSRKVKYFSLEQQKFLPGAPIRGRMITVRNKKKGVEDMDGNIIIPHEYKRLEYTQDSGRFLLAQNFKGKYGLFDDSQELLPVVYDEIHCRTIGSPCAVRQGDDWFLVRKGGERVSDKRYDWLDDIRNGYVIYGKKCRDDIMRFGLMNLDENIVIRARYEHLSWCYGERLSCGELFYSRAVSNPAKSWQMWKYGIIDCADNIVVPKIYPMPLKGGVNGCYRASHAKHLDWQINGIIDESGNEVIPFSNWGMIRCCGAYRIYDFEKHRFGLYSSSGEELLPFEYERMYIGDTLDYIAVCKDGEWYYINQHGERVLL